MKSGVYLIRNVKNQRIYIGSSENVYHRKKEHWWTLRAGKHHSQKLQADWNVYGEDCFEFVVVRLTSNDKEIKNLEESLIEKLNAVQSGYNTLVYSTRPIKIRCEIHVSIGNPTSKIHPNDWETWQELIQSIKEGQRPNLASNKRKRALLAIARLVEEAQGEKMFEVGE
jgi:group I intron endonuclease